MQTAQNLGDYVVGFYVISFRCDGDFNFVFGSKSLSR